MKNWDYSIHQHVQKFECAKLELFCFIFVEAIKKFMGCFFGGHPVFSQLSLIDGGACGVMVIVVGNGHGDTSSNPERD